jgi:pimeloyl-ACP methyl ester carboxylesterase
VRLLAVVCALVAAPAVLALLATVVAYARAARPGPAAAPGCPADREEPLAPASRAIVVLQEALATTIATATLPLALVDRRRCTGRRGGRAVVFAHGPLPLWLPALPVVRALVRAGGTVVRAASTSWPGGAARDVAALAHAVARARAAAGTAGVTVVAHGAGALAARRLLADGDRAVTTLVTLGAPHRRAGGTPAGSTDVTAIFSVEDAVVAPSDAYWAGVPNVQVRGVGHLALLFAPLVVGLVCEAIGGEARPAATGS